jgi:hypothetical protein
MGGARLAILLLFLAAACGSRGDGREVGPGSPGDEVSAVEPRQVEVPAGSGPGGADTVIGAIPGPCGATRANRFLGRAYRPDMNPEIMAASGAVAVRVAAPVDENAPEEPTVDRRINLVLNSRGEIILMDCG